MRCFKFSIFLIILSLAACQTRISRVTFLSTRDLTPQQLAQLEPGKEKVSGADMQWIFFVFPFDISKINLATEEALKKKPGAVALKDVTIYTKGWWLLFFGRGGYKVEGVPMMLRRPVVPTATP